MAETRTIKVGIAGVRGYKGLEMARLIAGHPGLRVAMVASDAMAGASLRDVDPELVRDGDAPALGYTDTVSAAVDYGIQLMFLCTKPERSAVLARDLVAEGIRVIDLSGAHCISDADAHLRAYGFMQVEPELNARAVYGLCEWVDHDALRAAALVASPTSYATLVLLALRPLAAASLLASGTVVVDAKSGASAAGRKARISLLASELWGNFYASKIDRHQHTPEIIEQLAPVTAEGFKLTLATHLLPVARGMFATCYFRVPGPFGAEEGAERVRAALRQAYENKPFVQVLDRAEQLQLRSVVGTNRCLLGATADPYGDRVVVVAAIDNLLKGTAGQAVQSANLMLGFDEAEALTLGTGGRP